MNVKNINVICKENLNYSRLSYVLDFINGHPLKPQNIHFSLNDPEQADMEIIYSQMEADDYYIPFQKLFFSFTRVCVLDLFINEFLYNDFPVYSVEKEKSENEHFIIDRRFGFDIFETIFCHISRYEEFFADPVQKDVHLRMKSSEQLLFRNGIHHTPVVDMLVLSFFRALGFQLDDRPTSFSMTHDIDAIQKFSSPFKLPKSIVRVLLMGLGLKGVQNITKWYFKSLFKKENDPYFVFDSLLINDDIFVDKIIFFVAGGNTRFDLYNKNYRKNLPLIISKALSRAYSVGYHPSYDAYDDADMFKKELAILKDVSKQEIFRLRTHFLRMNFKSTLRIAAGYGIRLDSSLGYPDDVGFSCGTGFSYLLYDFENEKPSEIKELPLVVMDGSLLYIYCKDDIECFKQKLYRFITKNKFNTHITFNFHNSTFDRSLKSRKDLLSIYRELIVIIRYFPHNKL